MVSKDHKAGDIVQCSFRSTFYPAKILKIDASRKNGEIYFVHYQGWNKRSDEWVASTRLKTSADSRSKQSSSRAVVENVAKKPVVVAKTKTVEKQQPEKLQSSVADVHKRSRKSVSNAMVPTLKETKGGKTVPSGKLSFAKIAKPKSQKVAVPKRITAKRPAESEIDVSPVKRQKLEDAKPTTTEIIPSFKRLAVDGGIGYKSSDGKLLRTLAEVKKYFKQNRLIFFESDFDFRSPPPPISPNKKESPKLTRQALSPATKQISKQYQGRAKTMSANVAKKVTMASKKIIQSKISKVKGRGGRGKPKEKSSGTTKRLPPFSTSDKFVVITPDTSDAPMQLEIASNSPEPSEGVAHASKSLEKSVDFSLMHKTDPLDAMAALQESGHRPARSRKPNQRYNLLISEIDAMFRQGRRRRYSSKHSAVSSEDETEPPVKTLKRQKSSEKKVAVAKTGRRGRPKKNEQKVKTETKPKSPKRKGASNAAGASTSVVSSPKTRKLKNVPMSTTLMSPSTVGNEFESAPEFVEIQARGHSPQDQDDGLPPALGLTPDGAGLHSQSLESLPLVDSMCDTLAATSAMDTHTPDHLENSTLMSDFASGLHQLSSAAADSMPHDMLSRLSESSSVRAGDKKRVRANAKPSARKSADKTQHLSGDDFPTLESYKMSHPEQQPKRKKEKQRFYSSGMDSPPPGTGPGITNEEIEEGLKTLQALESRSLQSVKVPAFSALPQMSGIALSHVQQSSRPSADVTAKYSKSPKDSRRGRMSTSRPTTMNVEIPRLHRESETLVSNEFEQMAMKSQVEQHVQQQMQQRQQQVTDDSLRYCYLPPEIVGDHCYGKSLPTVFTMSTASASSADSPNVGYGGGGVHHQQPTHHHQSAMIGATTEGVVIAAHQQQQQPLMRLTPVRSRPVRYEMLLQQQQRSPSPPFKSSAFIMSDPMGAYSSYHNRSLGDDYGGSSSVTTSGVVLPASIMSGAEVPMLSGNLPANILDDFNDDDDTEVTAVNIQ